MTGNQTEKTLPWLLKHRVHKTPEGIAYQEKRSDGSWQKTTWGSFYESVKCTATFLHDNGIGRGDQIAIMMSNTLAWETVQQGAFMAGCVVIGLDRNDPEERLHHIVSLCRIKALVVESSRMLMQFPKTFLQSLSLIIVNNDSCGHHRFNHTIQLEHVIGYPSLSHLPEILGHFPATVLFTSGTTGNPKSLPYTHEQLITAVNAISLRIPLLPEQARTACWLPLANPFQRMVNMCAISMNWQSYMVSDPAAIMDEVKGIHPHFMASVPRFYEKIYETIQDKIDALPVFLKGAVRYSIKTGMAYRELERNGKKPAFGLKCSYRLAEAIFLKTFRQICGKNIRYYLSGSASMPPDLLTFFHAIGWLILESYGISENIVPVSMCIPEGYKFGSVGKPFPENDVKIANDGEVLIKGPGVSRQGVELTEDGYLKTGDAGRIDSDGFLYLTGRKADGFKLSTGRKVTPLPIENALKTIREVDHAVVEGRNQKYIVALLVITPENWQLLLCRYHTVENVKSYLEEGIASVCDNLPWYFRPLDFVVVNESFSVRSGELTSNLKVRRGVVLDKYQGLLEPLFKNKNASTMNVFERLDGATELRATV